MTVPSMGEEGAILAKALVDCVENPSSPTPRPETVALLAASFQDLNALRDKLDDDDALMVATVILKTTVTMGILAQVAAAAIKSLEDAGVPVQWPEQLYFPDLPPTE